MLGNWLVVRCRAAGRPDMRPRWNFDATALVVSGRIQQPVSRQPPSAAWRRFPGWASPVAIAAPQTSALRPRGLRPRGPRPRGPALAPGLYCPAAGRKAIGDARNLLRDWQARDNVAPTADNIRQIGPTRWPSLTARILPLERDSAAPPLYDQPFARPPTLIREYAADRRWVKAACG
jgi:hypothetical protein